nr:DUF4116 domain-containing protein [Fusobacterium necrophorum]
MLRYAAEELKDDKDVVLVAISNDGSALEFAAERLRNDEDVVLVAMKTNGFGLEFAKKFQNNKDIVREAAKQTHAALKFASDELKNDKQFMEEILKYNNWCLKYVSEELKDDKEFVLQAMKGKYDISLLLASERLQKDTDVVLENISNGLLRTMQYKLKCDIKDIEKKREIIKKNIESILLKKYKDKDILKAVEDTEKYENLEEILETIKK